MVLVPPTLIHGAQLKLTPSNGDVVALLSDQEEARVSEHSAFGSGERMCSTTYHLVQLRSSQLPIHNCSCYKHS